MYPGFTAQNTRRTRIEHVLLNARSMDLRARRTLQLGASLEVHSVFDKALNLTDQHRNVIGLVGPCGGNGPATVVLYSLPEDGFRQLGIHKGTAAEVMESDLLCIADLMFVNLGSATTWQRPSLCRPTSPKLRRENVERAAALAYELRGADGLGGLLPHRKLLLSRSVREPHADLTPLLRAAWAGLSQLLPGWRLGNARLVSSGASRLIGLGPGLTPAGDDLLAGLIVAQHRLRPVDSRVVILSNVCREVATGRTTSLGMSRLAYAACGELDECSENALLALLCSHTEAVESATRELLGYGHSSGLDTLVGMLLGLGLTSPSSTSNQ